jgi:hypothetical protein
VPFLVAFALLKRTSNIQHLSLALTCETSLPELTGQLPVLLPELRHLTISSGDVFDILSFLQCPELKSLTLERLGDRPFPLIIHHTTPSAFVHSNITTITFEQINGWNPNTRKEVVEAILGVLQQIPAIQHIRVHLDEFWALPDDIHKGLLTALNMNTSVDAIFIASRLRSLELPSMRSLESVHLLVDMLEA